MPSSQDLLQAKQTLSARLLGAGLRGGVVAMMAPIRVNRAIEMAGRNVHAVGIGKKLVQGKATTQKCVRVYVLQKMAESLLPPIYRIPDEIDGVPVDVIESLPAFILAKKTARRSSTRSSAAAATPSCSANRRARQRPVLAGISTGHFDITAGTLGYFCRSVRHGDDPTQVFALSNNHVYANVDLAHPGDALYQPAAADGGTAEDHFADLTRWVPIHLGGVTPNRVDAAIGALRPDVTHQAEICAIGSITDMQQGSEGLAVRKHGRTTGYTEGEIDDESYDALVGMDHSDASVVALFEDQLRIQRTDPYPAFGLGGDSGSLIIAKSSRKAVGLYFAGPPSGSYGVANPIHDVLNQLEIQLV